MTSKTGCVLAVTLGILHLCLADPESICSLVPEGHPTQLTCPPNTVVSSISSAVFGQFPNSTSCPSPTPTTLCPVSVKAHVGRLCVGHPTCNVSCHCDANSVPPCQCVSGSRVLGVPVFPCDGIVKALAVTAQCSPALPPPSPSPPTPPSPVSNLRVEFLEAPVLGMDSLRPQFNWQASVQQESYQVTVVAAHSGVSVYSSGRVSSRHPVNVPTAPLSGLKSDTVYNWTVSVWSSDTLLSSSSATATATATATASSTFTTGLLLQTDWSPAQWLDAGVCEPSPDYVEHTALSYGHCTGGLLRTDFTVKEGSSIGRASLFVSACQYPVVYLDGRQLGDHELDVTWTRFNLNRTYVSFDVPVETLGAGKHAVGVMVGQGFCGEMADGVNNSGRRAAILRLVLHAANDDSVVSVVATDDSWDAGQSPYRYENPYNGEVYDTDLEQPGWASPGFTPQASATWTPATVVGTPGAPGQPWLSSQLQPPMKAVHVMAPVSVNRVLAKPGAPALATPARWTYDFGQEFTGHVKFTLPAGVPPHTNVTLSHAEVLSHPPLTQVINGVVSKEPALFDGSVYTGNLFWARPIDTFMTGAKAGRVYETVFAYHGMRYVELSFSPALPDAVADLVGMDTLTGVNVRTAVREQASVTVANPLIQRLADNAWWTEASALMGMPNGCAGRGERAGWTGDAAIASESEMADFDTGAFFAEYLDQIQDVQCSADGSVPHCIPETDPNRGGFPSQDPDTCSDASVDPSWATVYPSILHNLWRYYNATAVVERHFPSVLQFIQMEEAKIAAGGGIGHTFCKWGDHQSLKPTNCSITASASFIEDLQRVADLAAVVGRPDVEASLRSKAAASTTAFQKAFWNNTSPGAKSQTAHAIALWLNAVPADEVEATAAALAADVLANGVTVGFLGVRYLLPVLARFNQTASLVQILHRAGFPGYDYELYNVYEPSTSLWESWTAPTMGQWVAESSRSHHYMASVSTSLRTVFGGVGLPGGMPGDPYRPDAVAWGAVLVKPYAAALTGELSAMVPGGAVSVDTHRGLVQARWSRTADDVVQVNVTLPTSSTGEVHVPVVGAPASTLITANGVPVWSQGAFQPSAVPGIESGSVSGDFVAFHTTGGDFKFEATRGPNPTNDAVVLE